MEIKPIVRIPHNNSCKIGRFPIHDDFPGVYKAFFVSSLPVAVVVDLTSFFDHIRNCRESCCFCFSDPVCKIGFDASIIHDDISQALSENFVSDRLEKSAHRFRQFPLFFVKLRPLYFPKHLFIFQLRNVSLQFFHHTALIAFDLCFSRRLALPGGIFCLPDDPGLPLLRREHGQPPHLPVLCVQAGLCRRLPLLPGLADHLRRFCRRHPVDRRTARAEYQAGKRA